MKFQSLKELSLKEKCSSHFIFLITRNRIFIHSVRSILCLFPSKYHFLIVYFIVLNMRFDVQIWGHKGLAIVLENRD